MSSAAGGVVARLGEVSQAHGDAQPWQAVGTGLEGKAKEVSHV